MNLEEEKLCLYRLLNEEKENDERVSNNDKDDKNDD